MRSSRRIIFTVLTAMLSLAAPGQAVHATAASRVECGFFEYVAADASNNGSISFGANAGLGLKGYRYVIGAGATVPSDLSSIAGAPTCLQLALDSGVVTEMHYVASGSMRGPVTVYGDPVSDPGNAFYVTAGRVMTPAFVLQTQPGLWAILGNAALTGEEADLTLTVDTTVGVPTGFTASTLVRGPVVMSPTDIGVGAGTLPEEVVDSASRSSLQKAQGNDQWAKVVITTTGTIDVNVGVTNVSTTLDVQRQAPDAVDGSVEGPCAGPAYHGVFDNSTGVHSVEFRFRWETAQGTRLVTQSVPAGQVYKTWPHWAKPGSIVRVSYRNRTTGRWINLSARMAVRGYFAPCSYTPGFE